MALQEVAKVSAFGAAKHDFDMADRGFLNDEYTEDMYKDAAVRHILDSCTEGPVNREDGDVYHLAQSAWDILAALEKHLIVQQALDDGYYVKSGRIPLPPNRGTK